MPRVRTRILVVEDDADNLEVLGMLFQAWGYESFLAETGERAIGTAAVHRPHIVLLDLDLPGIQGEEVVKILKRMPSCPYVVAYTGFERLEQAALAAGCDAFLLKPGLDRLATLLVSIDVENLVKETP